MLTGKVAEPHLAAVHFVRAAAARFCAERLEIAGEIVAIVGGLEADEVVIDETAEDQVVLRQRLENVRRARRACAGRSRSGCLWPRARNSRPSSIR